MRRLYCVPDFVLGVAKGAASASAVAIAVDICVGPNAGAPRE
jgi:hypothetical protein